MQECPFGILVWCFDGGFEGLVWYFNIVSIGSGGGGGVWLVGLVFLGGLVRWCCCLSVSSVVEERDRDKMREREINSFFFNSICL